MTVELPITFEAGPLFHDLLNQQFAAVQSALNAQQAQIDALSAMAEPDLSGYATVTQLSDHVAAAVPHSKILRWGDGTALVGSNLPAGQVPRVESAVVALSSGAGTFTFVTAFANGVLAAHATVHGGTARALALNGLSLSDVDIVGTGTDNVCVTVVGW